VAQCNVQQQVRLLRKTAALQGICQVAGYSTNVKKVLTREGKRSADLKTRQMKR
jgi:hypothetical protein